MKFKIPFEVALGLQHVCLCGKPIEKGYGYVYGNTVYCNPLYSGCGRTNQLTKEQVKNQLTEKERFKILIKHIEELK